ncbi:alpha-protein kinase 3 [Narcine bancroftii]|uniref:alpha-protein kinase 3 n=1 Tax=Narcine bancroftii TaxID=1343680 RepID=UPI003831EC27
MSSKRIIRSYSANGRYPSLDTASWDDDPPVRGESSRNYFLNVRPENRQTFCTIIAQITEETQPGFEATLKSHSVSENSDVKFTCIVTGHPAPEITWYKDDKEMDRYCGLPKYQIFQYGKKHALQLYKCTEDDAAIYQASARNSKGIVSCSGVLEVGTMNEYKIHQRWFAKLKQKAEAKRRELEETRLRGKVNIAQMANVQRTLSPERAQRKRKSQVEAKAAARNPSKREEDGAKVHIPDAASHKNAESARCLERMERPTAPNPKVQNGYLTGPQGTEPVVIKDGKIPVKNSLEDLGNGLVFNRGICEVESIILARPTDKEFAARQKKRKLSGEEGELSLREAEGCSQNTSDARNGVDLSQDSGILSRYLRDTLKRNKPHRDPRPFKSGDSMEIDEQVSSDWLGPRQCMTDPLSPKSQWRGQEKGPSGQLHKNAESEVEKFTNDARLIDPVDCSPQPSARDLYFSMKEMYFEAILGPVIHGQQQLAPVLGKSDEAIALSSDCAGAPYPMDAKSGDRQASEELQSMETSRTEVPRACSEELSTPRLAQAQPASEVNQAAGRSKPASVSGAEAGEAHGSPLSSLGAALPPALLGSCSLPAVQVEEGVNASLPRGQEVTLEDPGSALPAHRLAHEIPPKSIEQAEADISPASERLDSDSSVGALSDEWEKLDVPGSAEQADVSEVQPAAVVLTFGGTELDLMPQGCRGDDTSLTATYENVKPKGGKVDQATQTVFQQDFDLPMGVKVIKITAEPVTDNSQVIDFPETSQGELVLVDDLSLEVKEPMDQQVITDSQPKGTPAVLAVPSEGEVCASPGNEQVPEEMVAEIEDGLLKVDHTEKAELKEEEPGDESTEVFGTNLVEKFLSFLKIPNFLLGEKSPPEKPEGTADISPIDSRDEDTSASDTNKESTDASETPATGVDLCLGVKIGLTSQDVLLDSTGSLCPAEVGDTPSGKVGVEPQVGSSLEVPNAGTISFASPLLKVGVGALLPAAAPPTTREDGGAADMVDTGDSESSLHLERPLEECAEPSKMETLPHPSLGVAPSLPVALEVKILEGSQIEQGTTGQSNVDIITHKCLVDAAEESNRGEKIMDDGNELLQMTSVPSVGTIPASKAITPSSEDVTSGNALQATKIVADVPTADPSQVPSIVVNNITFKSGTQEEIDRKEGTVKDTPAAQGSGARIKLSDTPPAIPSATPAELASGARRKIFLPRSKQADESEALALDAPGSPVLLGKEEVARRVPAEGGAGHAAEGSSLFPAALKRSGALLQAPVAQQSGPLERLSPASTQKMSTLEVPKLYEEPEDKVEVATDSTKVKREDAKSSKNFLKAPQVIRKIRAEQFSDASGNLKLWCQFFNVLSDSTVRWDRDGLHLNSLKRSSGDESPVSLAIVQTSAKDCGVYRCVLENEYGSDATDFLLSTEMLTGFISREEIEVGEEIEMTPMPITKGLTDTGFWGNKLFGRIMTQELCVGVGFRRKQSRVKVIYGLEPIFESGATCIVKVRNYISFGTKNESGLVESIHNLTMQECKLQNTAREYSKIFAAETRVVDGFGPVPEVIPLHLLYRPANNIPYATIERDLIGQFMKYAMEDESKNRVGESGTETAQKCHTFQHWIYQWTNSNLLVTDLQAFSSFISISTAALFLFINSFSYLCYGKLHSLHSVFCIF